MLKKYTSKFAQKLMQKRLHSILTIAQGLLLGLMLSGKITYAQSLQPLQPLEKLETIEPKISTQSLTDNLSKNLNENLSIEAHQTHINQLNLEKQSLLANHQQKIVHCYEQFFVNRCLNQLNDMQYQQQTTLNSQIIKHEEAVRQLQSFQAKIEDTTQLQATILENQQAYQQKIARLQANNSQPLQVKAPKLRMADSSTPAKTMPLDLIKPKADLTVEQQNSFKQNYQQKINQQTKRTQSLQQRQRDIDKLLQKPLLP